mgnify:CR=1 FL=1
MFLIEGGIVMIANLVTILIMGMTFLYMMTKAQYAETRRVALIPLGVCAAVPVGRTVEMLLFGLHQGGGAFIVTLLLWVSRAAILVCCAGAMRRDAARAQRRQRRRAVRRTVEVAQAVSQEKVRLHLVPGSSSSRCA